MKYLCSFYGRKLGAIGIFYNIVIVVDAESPNGAKVKAYETHEHIQNFQAIPVP